MKQITIEQINIILQTVYNTNIPASQFDALRKILLELPEVNEDENKTTKKE